MKYIDAECLKAKLDEHYRKYQSKYMETRLPYTQGLLDALDLAEQAINSLQQERKPAWKPSEEQMKALEGEIRYCYACGMHDRGRELQSLYEQLKKL